MKNEYNRMSDISLKKSKLYQAEKLNMLKRLEKNPMNDYEIYNSTEIIKSLDEENEIRKGFGSYIGW